MYRRVISRYANVFARNLLGLMVNDVTTGCRAYKREVIQAIDLGKIKSEGYAFQAEILFEVHKKGFKIGEIPITFSDRRMGKSKISGYEIIKFFILCLELFLKRLKILFS